MKRWIAILLVFAVTIGLSACSQVDTRDLMQDISARTVNVQPDMDAGAEAAADFAVRLFQISMEEKNTLISPLSVFYALAMTANGADGETLEQMEQVIGMKMDALNGYMLTYLEQLPESKDYKLSLANSVWLKEDPCFVVEKSFLQTNADYYGAEIYQATFDENTRKAINHWVEEHTDGLIPEILDRIPDKAVMYLVNALVFDGKWDREYKEYQIREGKFTTEDGVRQNVDMMHSEEHTYLKDDMVTGFMKYYKGRQYAFVALLPNEDVSLSQYVESLTGEQLRNLINRAQNVPVYASIPKFETEYSCEMQEALQKMGMTNSFDWRLADFSRLGRYNADGMNLFINRVVHKTFISVSEQGTRAGAATVVEIAPGNAAPMEEIKEVVLNRPFLYMIVDCETGFPIFMGAMRSVNEG